jgi:hypothetical protein
MQARATRTHARERTLQEHKETFKRIVSNFLTRTQKILLPASGGCRFQSLF